MSSNESSLTDRPSELASLVTGLLELLLPGLPQEKPSDVRSKHKQQQQQQQQKQQQRQDSSSSSSTEEQHAHTRLSLPSSSLSHVVASTTFSITDTVPWTSELYTTKHGELHRALSQLRTDINSAKAAYLQHPNVKLAREVRLLEEAVQQEQSKVDRVTQMLAKLSEKMGQLEKQNRTVLKAKNVADTHNQLQKRQYQEMQEQVSAIDPSAMIVDTEQPADEETAMDIEQEIQYGSELGSLDFGSDEVAAAALARQELQGGSEPIEIASINEDDNAVDIDDVDIDNADVDNADDDEDMDMEEAI